MSAVLFIMEEARAWQVIEDRLRVTEGQDLIHLYDDWAETYDEVK